MAYRGSRDNHFSFRVPQRSCYPYTSSSGEDFIEIRLPGDTIRTWYSFMVSPEQVCYDRANPGLGQGQLCFLLIYINLYDIILSIKNKGGNICTNAFIADTEQ